MTTQLADLSELMTTHFVGMLLAGFGLTLLLATLSVLLVRGPARPGEGFSTPARFFLVALRLAIGWHMLIEGVEKLQTPGWTAEPYLRASIGPLAPYYRGLAGDPLADRLTVADDKEAPPLLARDWQAYLDEFTRHYKLDDEQAKRAHAIFDQAKSKAVLWLTSTKEAVQLPSSVSPPPTVALTVPERLEVLARLQRQANEAAALLPSDDPALLKKFKDATASVNKWRGELKKGLAAQTAAYQKNLRDVLKDAKTGTYRTFKTTDAAAVPRDYSEMPPMTTHPRPPMPTWSPLEWSDFLIAWGLVVIGGALLLGLLSRLSSAAGALLVLSFYLAMPPLPGWPEPPRAEGHYLLINKTLIEAIALMALASIPTGRWAGIDGLLQFIWPGRRKAAAPKPDAKSPTEEVVAL